MYGLAGLSNLVVSRQPAGVDCRTGAANNAAEQCLCQLLCQLDAGVNVLGDAAANRYDEPQRQSGRPASLASLTHLENLGLDVLHRISSKAIRLNDYCV